MTGQGGETIPEVPVMPGRGCEPNPSIKEVANGTWIKLSTSFITQLKRLKGAKALVWLAIALRINEDHVSFPSIARICEDTGYSNREVIDTLKELEENGFLIVRRRDHKHNIYRVNNYAAFGGSNPVIPTGEEISPGNFLPKLVKSDVKIMLKTSLKQESINKIKQDERDGTQTDFQKVWKDLEGLCGAVALDTARLIDVWIEKHPVERILQAVGVAREKRARSPKYVDQVLIGWEANGYPPTREQQVLERAFKPARSKPTFSERLQEYINNHDE